MTFFDTDNIPDEIAAPALGAQHFEAALEVIKDAVVSGAVAAYEAKAAYAYERHDWLETDPIVGRRNESYNTELDDILVQVTVRIPRTELFDKFEVRLQKEDALIREEKAREDLKAIEAEEAALAVRKAEAQAALKNK